MIRTTQLAASITALGLALASCATEPAVGSVTSEIADGCPKFSGCGDNSPVMGPFDSHELNVRGRPNKEGLAIQRFLHGGVEYYTHIEQGSQLVATPLNPADGPTLTGTGLIGGYFEILATTTNEIYKLSIAGVSPVATSPTTFWVGPAAPIETYELMYTGPRGRGPLCPNPTIGTAETWAKPLEAILFTGDRYDAGTLSVSTESVEPGWFNIGCSGSALAKLHLMRHTLAGSLDGANGGPSWLTTIPERQALLKMYTGDFCGNGIRWTVAGTPLHWSNLERWTSTTPSAITGGEEANEAYWSDAGAQCLDEHRLGAEFAAAVRASCRWIPSCQTNLEIGAPPVSWPAGALIHSVVPVIVAP